MEPRKLRVTSLMTGEAERLLCSTLGYQQVGEGLGWHHLGVVGVLQENKEQTSFTSLSQVTRISSKLPFRLLISCIKSA